MIYLNNIQGSGVSLTLSDYRDLDALTRDDLVLWREAERQKQDDDYELIRLGNTRAGSDLDG